MAIASRPFVELVRIFRILPPRASFFVLWVVLALAGCGGSSGGDDNVVNPPPPPPPPPPPTNTVSADIGTAGGMLQSSDGKLTLTIPANALTATQTISIRTLATADLSQAVRDLDPQEAYRFSPNGLSFSEPAEIRLTLDRAPATTNTSVANFISPVVIESNGTIEVLDEVSIEGAPGATTSVLRANIRHFSDVARVRRLATLDQELFNENNEPLINVTVSYVPKLSVGQIADGVLRYQTAANVQIDTDSRVATSMEILNGPLLISTSPPPEDSVAAFVDNEPAPKTGNYRFVYLCTEPGLGAIAASLEVSELAAGGVMGVLAFGNANAPSINRAEFATVLEIECMAEPPPTAADDSYSINSNATLTVPVETGVLANDTNAEGISGALQAQVANQPNNGALLLNTDGSFTYTPNTDFVGTDSFTYRAVARDGQGASDDATVSIVVSRLCDTSVASASVQVIRGTGFAQAFAFEGISFTTTIPENQFACLERVDDEAVFVFNFFGAAPTTSVAVQLFDDDSTVINAETLRTRLPALGFVTGTSATAPDLNIAIDDRSGRAPISAQAPANTDRIVLEGGTRNIVGDISGPRQARLETPTEILISLFGEIGSFARARLTRIGGHTDADIEFSGINGTTFTDLNRIDALNANLPFTFVCHNPGEYRVRADVEVEYTIVNTASGEDLPAATLTYSAEFSITCLDEAAAPRSFVLNFTKPEGMTYVNPTQLQTLSGFPIPNLTNESIPVVVAGTQNQFGPGLGTPLAVDIRTGSTLFAYAFNGVLFDAYPLVGPLDDPDGNVDRILAMSGQSGVALKGINENGTDGATLVDTSNRFAADTSYLLGAEQQAIVFTQPTAGATTNPGSIRVIRHSETSGLPGDFRFNRQRPFDPPSFEGGQGIMRSPKTAVGNADGTKLVVAGGPGAPAELRLVERTVDGQTITDTHTVIGNVGSDPRRIRCDELPPPRNDYLCGLTDFTDNTVQLFTWNLQSTVTLGPIVNVGQGPVGLDVKGNKIVVANFGDDSINYITFDPADPLNASLLTNQTLDLDAIPDINCDNPGHAIVIDDTEVSLPPGIIATVVASCNSSNNLAVIPIRFGF